MGKRLYLLSGKVVLEKQGTLAVACRSRKPDVVCRLLGSSVGGDWVFGVEIAHLGFHVCNLLVGRHGARNSISCLLNCTSNDGLHNLY